MDLRLRHLKTNYNRDLRGGREITPNLICRLALCLSLEEPGVPDPTLYADKPAREFNRHTLTGDWDPLFFALLRERMVRDGLDPERDMEEQLVAHLSRGVHLLWSRAKNLEDIAPILAKARQVADKYEAAPAS